jgi:hypothetical protein
LDARDLETLRSLPEITHASEIAATSKARGYAGCRILSSGTELALKTKEEGAKMKIVGLGDMTVDELRFEINRGGKFVIFEYCVSILILTFKNPTDVHFIRSGESAAGKSFGYSLVSLVLGWWGFPWGPIYTISSLVTNLRGGKDVTREVVAALGSVPRVA